VAIGDAGDARSFEVLIARYLEWRDVHGYSQRARGSCESTLRSFGTWCAERGVSRPVEVTRGMVERYQRWLYHHRRPDGRPLAVRTQIGRLSYLRSFCRWMAKERYVLYNPASAIEMPKEPVTLPMEGFTLAEVEQVMATPDVKTPLGLRNRALLELLFSTGIRRSEITALDLYDLDAEHGVVTIRQGKGGKDRVVPVGERALAWLARYLEDVRPHLVLHADEWALFVSHEGVRFSSGGLGNEVTKIIKASRVRKRIGSCHLFRHSMATLMLEGGADIRFIQEILGHSKLETTQVYTRVSIGHLKKIHAATHPAASLKGTKSLEPTCTPATDVELLRAALEAEVDEELAEDADDAGRSRPRSWVPRRLR
jgi:integrase/recombinase XerD